MKITFGATVGITLYAVAITSVAMVISSVIAAESSGNAPGMVNQLRCSTMGAGQLAEYTPGTEVQVRDLIIRSARMCSWDFPSEYTAGRLVQHWVNPPVAVTLPSGAREQLPGSDEYFFTTSTARGVFTPH